MPRYEGVRRAQDLRKIKRKEVRVRVQLEISMHMSFMRQLEKFLFELYEEKKVGNLLVLQDRLKKLTNCREVEELNTMLKTFSKQYQSQGVTKEEDK